MQINNKHFTNNIYIYIYIFNHYLDHLPIYINQEPGVEIKIQIKDCYNIVKELTQLLDLYKFLSPTHHPFVLPSNQAQGINKLATLSFYLYHSARPNSNLGESNENCQTYISCMFVPPQLLQRILGWYIREISLHHLNNPQSNGSYSWGSTGGRLGFKLGDFSPWVERELCVGSRGKQ